MSIKDRRFLLQRGSLRALTPQSRSRASARPPGRHLADERLLRRGIGVRIILLSPRRVPETYRRSCKEEKESVSGSGSAATSPPDIALLLARPTLAALRQLAWTDCVVRPLPHCPALDPTCERCFPSLGIRFPRTRGRKERQANAMEDPWMSGLRLTGTVCGESWTLSVALPCPDRPRDLCAAGLLLLLVLILQADRITSSPQNLR